MLQTTNQIQKSLPIRWILVGLAAVLMLAGWSCRGSSSSPSAVSQSATSAGAAGSQADTQAEEDPEPYYSPFVLRLEGGKFDTISFKDVGLHRQDGEPDTLVLEVISESLAHQLADHEALGYSAQVAYDESRLDPANHLHCGLKHLYIDVWQSRAPERWGYSLWSGCSELDNFAWKEIRHSAPDSDLPAYVAPLTESITDSIAKASQANCFQKNC